MDDIEISIVTFEEIFDSLNDLMMACQAADDRETEAWVRSTLEHMSLLRRRYLGQEGQEISSHQVH